MNCKLKLKSDGFFLDEMRSLIRVLVMFHYDAQAETLQKQYDSFLTLIDKSIPDIWIDEDTSQEFKPVRAQLTFYIYHISQFNIFFIKYTV